MPQFNQLQIYQGNVIWERGQVVAASEAEAAMALQKKQQRRGAHF